MPKSSQHPGVIVKALIDDYRLTPAKVAKDLSLSYSSLRLLLNGKLRVSAPVALKLSKYFEHPVQYWIDLQNKFELAEAASDAELSGILKKIQKAKKEEAPKVPRKAGRAKASPSAPVKDAKTEKPVKRTRRKKV
jgi:addiction module HigA family antidote